MLLFWCARYWYALCFFRIKTSVSNLKDTHPATPHLFHYKFMYCTFDKDREFQMRSTFLQLFILSVNLWVYDFNWYDRMNEWMQSGWNELSMPCWCGIQQFEPKVFNYLMTNRLSLTSISSAWNFDYKKEIIIRNVASVAPLDITYICSLFFAEVFLIFTIFLNFFP